MNTDMLIEKIYGIMAVPEPNDEEFDRILYQIHGSDIGSCEKGALRFCLVVSLVVALRIKKMRSGRFTLEQFKEEVKNRL